MIPDRTSPLKWNFHHPAGGGKGASEFLNFEDAHACRPMSTFLFAKYSDSTTTVPGSKLANSILYSLSVRKIFMCNVPYINHTW